MRTSGHEGGMGMLYYRFVWLIVGIVVMVGGVHACASRKEDNSLSPLTPDPLPA